MITGGNLLQVNVKQKAYGHLLQILSTFQEDPT